MDTKSLRGIGRSAKLDLSAEPPIPCRLPPKAQTGSRHSTYQLSSLIVGRVIGLFTSLRLTVTLLAFAILLVFIGTLAEVGEGLYVAQAQYFRQWIIFGVNLFGRHLPILLPGGYLIGTLLLLNLLAAHIFRFRLSVSKIGIQLVHAGVILLIVGQLATDMLAHEFQMYVTEGNTKSYAEKAHGNELAFTIRSDSGSEQLVTIPEQELTEGAQIQDAKLPFSIRVKTYWKNSVPSYRSSMVKNGPPLAANGVALRFDFHEAAETNTSGETNVPAALIEIIGPNGSLGDWVVSNWTTDDQMVDALRQAYAQQLGPDIAQKVAGHLTQDQSIDVAGKKYTFALRTDRVSFPFSLTLLKATHTIYEGTEIPKDFRSLIRLQNQQTGEDREVEISMNHPLRYDGLTFYQYQMDAGEAARVAGREPSSIFQVVRNPGWLTPYIGCALVALGMIVQFMFHLVRFLSKRRTA
jgi:hypothetical protein